jgi:hypothetical protein
MCFHSSDSISLERIPAKAAKAIIGLKFFGAAASSFFSYSGV